MSDLPQGDGAALAGEVVMMREEVIGMFACHCGARDETNASSVDCWKCGAEMHRWNERQSRVMQSINAAPADVRTLNGGYDAG